MIKSEGKKVAKRMAIYLRVSTTEQTTNNQRRELHAVAKRHGWSVVQVFEDAGISGAGRKDRPALDALLKAVASSRPFVDGPLGFPAGASRQRRRSLPPSAGPRHLHTVWSGDVSNDGRLCRV